MFRFSQSSKFYFFVTVSLVTFLQLKNTNTCKRGNLYPSNPPRMSPQNGSISRRFIEPSLGLVSGLFRMKFKMAAAGTKFVWLETLRNVRKTSLVQDGKR